MRAITVAQWVVALTPALCAIVVVPALASPFIVAKSSTMTACAALSLALVGAFASRARIISLRDPLVLTAFAGLAWLGLVTAASPLRYLATSTATLIAAAAILFECSRRVIAGAEHLLIRSLAFAALLISIIALTQFALSDHTLGRMRVIATLGNPNFVGEFLAACIPAILIIRTQWSRRLLLGTTCAAILCTGSRAAVLAAAVASILSLVLAPSTTERMRRLVLLLVVFLAAVASLLIVARWNPRTLRTSLQGRATIWRVALHETHWPGTGLGTFSHVYLPAVGSAMRSGLPVNPTFITPERHAQNDLVEMLVETGPIGALILFALFALWLRRAFESRSEHSPFAIATVSTILVAAMFDFPLHRAETLSLLAVVMGLPLAGRCSTPEPNSPTLFRRYIAVTLGAVLLTFAALPVLSSRLIRLGTDAENRGQFHLAATRYSRAAWLWPDNTDAAFSLARVLARAERYPEALAATDRAKRYIAEPELYLLRARILESMNDYVSAEREMQSAAQLFPFSTIPQSELEEIHSNQHP